MFWMIFDAENVNLDHETGAYECDFFVDVAGMHCKILC